MLTRDDQAVLSHDPWLHPALVRLADGSPLDGEDLLLRDLTLETLQRTYRFACAASGFDEHCEGPTTLSQVLELLRPHPTVALYLDLKIERPRKKLTASARRTIWGVLSSLRAAALPNPVWVEGGSPAILAELKRQAGALRHTAVLSLPRFDAGIDDRLEAILSGVEGVLGLRRPARRAARAGADAFASPSPIISRPAAQAAARLGPRAVLFGIDEGEQLQRLLQWPLAALIVDDSPSIRAALP